MLVFLHQVYSMPTGNITVTKWLRLFSVHSEHNCYTMAAFYDQYFVTMDSDESQLSVLLYYSLLSATNFPGDSLSRKLISTFKNNEEDGADIYPVC